MKFALQVKDEDFDKARELLGEAYDDKSNLLIFDPLTGEPPAGQFVLIAISSIWIPKYADRISGYISEIGDIKELIKTANYLEFGRKEKTKEGEGAEETILSPEEELEAIIPTENDSDFLDISQDEDVKNFYLEPETPAFVKGRVKEENSNDFSFEFGKERQEAPSKSGVETKLTAEPIEEKPKEIIEEKEVEEVEEARTPQEPVAKIVVASPEEATIPASAVREIKRIYLSDSDMTYTVGVSIHIKYSSKVIAIVDEKMFQKYGDCLDENVYVFKTFREMNESSLQNYVLIITAKDKAQDEKILVYSKNPIVYWEEINKWVEEQK